VKDKFEMTERYFQKNPLSFLLQYKSIDNDYDIMMSMLVESDEH